MRTPDNRTVEESSAPATSEPARGCAARFTRHADGEAVRSDVTDNRRHCFVSVAARPRSTDGARRSLNGRGKALTQRTGEGAHSTSGQGARSTGRVRHPLNGRGKAPAQPTGKATRSTARARKGAAQRAQQGSLTPSRAESRASDKQETRHGSRNSRTASQR